jgi:DNA-binding MarR family transcriptional regulator
VPEPEPASSTPTLLRTAYNVLSAAIYGAVAQAGAPGLRPAHGNAMEMLAIEDGLRLTDIAARAGMAPQSMGELVDDLVSKGYLHRQEDPADRRAKRIYLTAQGHRTALVSQQAVRQAEEQIRALLGPRQYQQLRHNLARIAQLELPPATAFSTAEDHPDSSRQRRRGGAEPGSNPAG